MADPVQILVPLQTFAFENDRMPTCDDCCFGHEPCSEDLERAERDFGAKIAADVIGCSVNPHPVMRHGSRAKEVCGQFLGMSTITKGRVSW